MSHSTIKRTDGSDTFLTLEEHLRRGGRELQKAILIGVDLSNKDLSNADLTGAKLCSANLRKTNFKYADLTDADLSSSNLTEAKLHSAILHRTVFSNVVAPHVGIGAYTEEEPIYYQVGRTGPDSRLVFHGAADAKNLKFDGSDLSGAKLGDLNLRNATFRGALLVGADLFRSDLTDASFDHANLEGANCSETKCVRTKMDTANIVNANFDFAKFRDPLMPSGYRFPSNANTGFLSNASTGCLFELIAVITTVTAVVAFFVVLFVSISATAWPYEFFGRRSASEGEMTTNASRLMVNRRIESLSASERFSFTAKTIHAIAQQVGQPERRAARFLSSEVFWPPPGYL